MTNDSSAAATTVEDGLPAPESGQVFGLPSQEQWAEWGQMRGIRLTPERTSQVPQLLQGIREFNDLAVIRQRLFDSEARLNKQHAAMTARNEARRTRYEAALRQATLEGIDFPEKPACEEWGGMSHDRELFGRHHAILEAIERQLLHDRSDDWKEYIRKQARPAHVKAAKAREALAQAEEVLQPFWAAREALDKVIDQVAEKVAGMTPDVEERIIQPLRRLEEALAEERVLQDFLDSRVEANGRGFLGGRR